MGSFAVKSCSSLEGLHVLDQRMFLLIWQVSPKCVSMILNEVRRLIHPEQLRNDQSEFVVVLAIVLHDVTQPKEPVRVTQEPVQLSSDLGYLHRL